MVESKLSFFEKQIEGSLGQAAELDHLALCIAQETYDSFYVTFARSELTGLVIDSEALIETDIHQPVVTRPAVRMYDHSRVNVTPYNPLQCGLGAVRHDFCIDHALTFEQPEDNRLSVGTASATITFSFSTKARFINFNLTIQR